MANAGIYSPHLGSIVMLEKYLLGSTELQISRIGLGTVKFGRNQGVKYPTHFELPSDAVIQDLLAIAREQGINLLDTAPAYGTSEERLGKLLKNTRHDWVICTKAGEDFINGESHFDFSAYGLQRSIERSLQRLRTDYLDIVLIHSDGNDVQLIKKYGVLDTLNECKKRGLIRAYGISTKTVAGGILAVDHSDVVMVTHNPVYTEEQPVIAYAYQNKKGVLIKKALASGHAEKFAAINPAQAALRFIFAEPGVSCVIAGTINKDHLLQWVLAASLCCHPAI